MTNKTAYCSNIIIHLFSAVLVGLEPTFSLRSVRLALFLFICTRMSFAYLRDFMPIIPIVAMTGIEPMTLGLYTPTSYHCSTSHLLLFMRNIKIEDSFRLVRERDSNPYEHYLSLGYEPRMLPLHHPTHY